jgi:pyruvate dehydrogenase E2 component (dihydrolipoamide acetyltransferase)
MPSSPASELPRTGHAGAVSDLVMPKLGLTMTEGVLAEWHVRPGDRVEPGQVMFVVETDKIANEIEAPGAGEIVEILVDSGETVPVGAPLARWTGKGAVGEGAIGEGAGGNGAGGTGAQEPVRETATAPAPPAPASASPAPSRGRRVIATPLARRMARQGAVDIADITGSGPRGRIKAADVEAAIARQGEAPAEPAPVPAEGERIAVSSRHMAMVRRVTAAQREIPQFTVTARAEVSALLELRRAMNAAGGPKITLGHLVLKAVGRALLARPEANRIWAGDALRAFATSDVGMVVDAGGELFVPVLRDAGRLPLDRLAAAADDLAARSRAGALRREDLQGGAVSVSNVGMAGRLESVAPMVNAPQSSILGVGSVIETFRPDAEGRPKLCRELVLTLACDHRVLAGMGAARFLDAVVDGLAAPHGLLLTTDKGS